MKTLKTMTLRDRFLDALSKAPPMYPDDRRLRTFSEPTTPEHEQWRKETFGTVKIVPRIEHPGIDPEMPLSRFIDLPKLLDLVVNRELLLPRLAELKNCDPHECSAKPDLSQIPREEIENRIIALREFAPKSEQDSVLQQSWFWLPRASGERFEDRIKKMPLDDLIQAFWFMEHTRLKQELVCSCWYGNKMESDAMWRLFCANVGVSITTSVARLKRAVTCFVPKVLADHVTLSLAKVVYDDVSVCGETPPWLIKRTAYRHEDEVRLYLDYPMVIAPGFSLIVNPHLLIEKITVTPYAQKWQADAIQAAMERLFSSSEPRRIRLGRPGPALQQSTHMGAAEPSWPESADPNYFARLQPTDP